MARRRLNSRALITPLVLACIAGVSAAGEATAWPFGNRDANRTAAQAAAGGAGQAPAQTQALPAASSAAERATWARLEPLTRSVMWRREVEINPRDAEAVLGLASSLRQLGQHDAGVETIEAFRVYEPDHGGALMELGRLHIARGQGFYAIAPLERARDLDPRDWRVWSYLGVAYDQVRRNDDARAAWTQALVLSPDNPAVLSNVAMAMAAQGQATEAETILRRAVAQPGHTLQVRLNLALVLGLQGKIGEAEALLRRDLPPEQAEQNLQWIRARMNAGVRTWESVAGS
ncbi:MAG: tetratricopeptide repeat protein [Brevundimonas sp.]|jgi:Flp pilus assembly protein TadD|uniref:tetratricopeptide repeat protein n=1 Tax=Brevundimonas sp. TaxID=1871086 RepID=UPI0039193A05